LVAINRERETGVARDGNQAESVAFSLLYTYNSEGNIGRTIKIPAFAIDKG